jgi:hypothetical protein
MSNSFKINLGIAQLPDDQLPPEVYAPLTAVYRAIHNLLRGVSQYCGIDAPNQSDWNQLSVADTLLHGQLTRIYIPASVAITRGQVVNLHNNAGVLNARLAVATSATTMAHGVANNTVAIGEICEINWLRGSIDSIGALTVGTLYWLSTTPGAVQNLAPVAVGQIQQPIGLADGVSSLMLDIPLSYRQL